MTDHRAALLLSLVAVACAGGRVVPDRPARPDASAREFTANVRVTRPDATYEERLYVGNGGTRSESASSGEEVVVLHHFDRKTTIFLVTSQQAALQMPELDPEAPRPDDYLAATDGRPCAAAHSTCERVGEAQVGPFQTVEWRVEEGTGAARLSRRIWVDQATRVKVKTVTTGAKTETTEFLDLQMGHQPDGLFAVPDGYLMMRATKAP